MWQILTSILVLSVIKQIEVLFRKSKKLINVKLINVIMKSNMLKLPDYQLMLSNH